MPMPDLPDVNESDPPVEVPFVAPLVEPVAPVEPDPVGDLVVLALSAQHWQMNGGFDPAIAGVSPITLDGTPVPSGVVQQIIDEARVVNVTIERRN